MRSTKRLWYSKGYGIPKQAGDQFQVGAGALLPYHHAGPVQQGGGLNLTHRVPLFRAQNASPRAGGGGHIAHWLDFGGFPEAVSLLLMVYVTFLAPPPPALTTSYLFTFICQLQARRPDAPCNLARF